jgi:dihydrofolate reductase
MISAILASTASGGIGNKGTLPWPKHSEDLQYFKNITNNQVVVMGRKTWDDPLMPNPLPDRINCVFTHTPLKDPLSARKLTGNVVEELTLLAQQFHSKEIIVIGGKSLFEAAEPIIEKIYWTRMKGDYWADTRVNLETWLTTFRIKKVRPGDNCTYEVWEKQYF